MANLNLLRKLYLFKDLTEKELTVVAGAASSKSYMRGDEVFTQGERAKALYLIQSGTIQINQKPVSGDVINVARLGEGAHFGEMAFIDGENRSATATAAEQSELIVIEYDKLSDIFISNPAIATHFYRQMAHFLCGRLRVTTTDLAFVRSQNLSHF